jgi:hypothetical protein
MRLCNIQCIHPFLERKAFLAENALPKARSEAFERAPASDCWPIQHRILPVRPSESEEAVDASDQVGSHVEVEELDIINEETEE